MNEQKAFSTAHCVKLPDEDEPEDPEDPVEPVEPVEPDVDPDEPDDVPPYQQLFE
ncbi:hypothetical protein [Trinickia violacea]|uniref:hypothetical protein n=1 Tax=Trinickia violacea TaxID=2571746 RepID=UPI0015866EDE|nr:hypothetical protein [Trinickia violacea]